MPSKSREARERQKQYWEKRLEQRLSHLAEKGLGQKEAAKDSAVRKIRANLRDTESRLQVIRHLEKRNEEMAKARAEKESVPKAEKSKKKKSAEEETPEVSKRQLKKKKKKEEKASA